MQKIIKTSLKIIKNKIIISWFIILTIFHLLVPLKIQETFGIYTLLIPIFLSSILVGLPLTQIVKKQVIDRIGKIITSKMLSKQNQLQYKKSQISGGSYEETTFYYAISSMFGIVINFSIINMPDIVPFNAYLIYIWIFICQLIAPFSLYYMLSNKFEKYLKLKHIKIAKLFNKE